MEQQFSTSKVTVEYFDPDNLYQLVAPGLVARLPLRDLHWRSPSRPLRSIQTLHVELVSSKSNLADATSPLSPTDQKGRAETATRDDGFQTASIAGQLATGDVIDRSASNTPLGRAVSARRHQIPGLRRTPYLKLLLVRCDDNDTYKSETRAQVREWIRTQTASSGSTRKAPSMAENHDAFEWMIIHVVIPNTAAAAQSRVSGNKGGSDSNPDVSTKSNPTSRWRPGSSTLLEKFRSDFNSSGKNAVDRVVQIRIGINDVPYDVLPRVVPVVPTGYQDTEQDTENAWSDLIGKFKSLILSSFDLRVSQYEEDIKEKDAQRSLPGWNFCTFFILKEGLARGFESVGLVEDALVGYDELSVGLDNIVEEQQAATSAESRAGSLLSYTTELQNLARKTMIQVATGNMEFDDEESVDLQSTVGTARDQYDDIPISSAKKPYRELILANNVSVFDFRCYIFARQISLLLRLGNAWSTREELLAKLKEQQESTLHGVNSHPAPSKPTDESESLTMLAEICRRALAFIPTVSQVVREDIISGLEPRAKSNQEPSAIIEPVLAETIDNIVSSFAFSVAQQVLAQSSTRALPIPPSVLAPSDSQEQKTAIPEPKTMMHPARTSSLHVRPGGDRSSRVPPSPGIFPGPGRRASVSDIDAANVSFLKAGLEELAARRAELYALCRNILEEGGARRGWTDGWNAVPIVGEVDVVDLVDVNLNDDAASSPPPQKPQVGVARSLAGINNELFRAALDNSHDYYRLYEILTDKALRHYIVAGYTQSVHANRTDLAVLKFYLKDFGAAASHFYLTTPFYGESGWSLLELSMLIMYAQCLAELKRRDDYAKVALKLLSKAAYAQRDKLGGRLSLRQPNGESQPIYPQKSAIKGFLPELLAVVDSLNKDLKAPLVNFFSNVQIDNAPINDDGQDGFSLRLRLESLFADEFEVETASLRLTSQMDGADPEIWLQNKAPVVLRPGRNMLELRSQVLIPGDYEADQIVLSGKRLSLRYERDVGQPTDKSLAILDNPCVRLFRQASCLDVRLSTARIVQLDQNNSLEIEVLTGWNDIKSCEVKLKAATAGLRLISGESKILGSMSPTKPPEGGSFTFGTISTKSSIKIRLPFTLEQDYSSISVKVDVSYTTDRGSFSYSMVPLIPISLALAVNVQDVFKHNALFSRFTISTDTFSPLRLYKSELGGSSLFEPHFGRSPDQVVTVFPRQPASLLFKITRKQSSAVDKLTGKTIYLKLHYGVMYDEIEVLVRKSIEQALKESPLWEYFPLVASQVSIQLRHGLSDHELEKSALLGEVRLVCLAKAPWDKLFSGLGTAKGLEMAPALAEFMGSWHKMHSVMVIPPSSEPHVMIIPVDIPSPKIVHTADIRLHVDKSALVEMDRVAGGPCVCINQLLPAVLHLKWTRIWNTDTQADEAEDVEFSYEVTAPSDMWLIGGRRKGHFVIPAGVGAPLTSGPDTEADVALLLVPLREGWLPYPNVEIREVGNGAVQVVDAAAGATGDHEGSSPGSALCETDYRNAGEAVHVIADRAKVTLSLDASGPGGGPLVLESAKLGMGGRIVA